MARDAKLKELEGEYQQNLWRYAIQLIDEAVEKGLTRQVVISIRNHQLYDIRNNNIVTGATIVDYFVQSM